VASLGCSSLRATIRRNPIGQRQRSRTLARADHSIIEETPLFAECNVGGFPATIPSSGRNYFIFINAYTAEAGGGPLGFFFGQPGTPSGSPGPTALIYECKLTNDNSSYLLNVELTLELVFQKAIDDKNHSNSKTRGEIFSRREYRIKIPRIERDNFFIFFIWHQSPYFVNISFPATATVQIGGNQTKRHIGLIVPINQRVELFPYAEPKTMKR
jgi:hypothetical protein